MDATLMARLTRTLVVRGAVALGFGLLTVFAPLSLPGLIVLFGAYVLVDATANLALARVQQRAGGAWLPFVLEGAPGLIVGLIAMAWPNMSALAFLWSMAAWALAVGAASGFAAIFLRRWFGRKLRGHLLGLVSSAGSAAFGVMLLLDPGPGGLAGGLWIGAFTTVSGTLLLLLAARVRRFEAAQEGEPSLTPSSSLSALRHPRPETGASSA